MSYFLNIVKISYNVVKTDIKNIVANNWFVVILYKVVYFDKILSISKNYCSTI